MDIEGVRTQWVNRQCNAAQFAPLCTISTMCSRAALLILACLVGHLVIRAVPTSGYQGGTPGGIAWVGCALRAHVHANLWSEPTHPAMLYPAQDGSFPH